MDVLSHGLWAVAAGKGARVDTATKLNLRWAFFWGVFPDIFAFAPIFILRFIPGIFTGISRLAPTGLEPWTPDFDTLSNATQYLYQLSHSLIIYAAIILIVWLLRKKVSLGMFGWLMHILADVPTHSYKFYSTPVFWPLYDWKFDGFSWGSGYFEIYNYIALIIVFALLYLVTRLRKNS